MHVCRCVDLRRRRPTILSVRYIPAGEDFGRIIRIFETKTRRIFLSPRHQLLAERVVSEGRTRANILVGYAAVSSFDAVHELVAEPCRLVWIHVIVPSSY